MRGAPEEEGGAPEETTNKQGAPGGAPLVKARYGIRLSRRSLRNVGGGGLFDDEAINLYFALLQERNNRALCCGERQKKIFYFDSLRCDEDAVK
ncbi:hypothetical protein, conserved [Eimeria praecox]|uniref:Uncharacterized protein n=1 Tax=Eimeria praecox TaxID=51316 RepID=U6H5T2_9EIME|nr:hypothetical protein, conserved [Eimeria praecox]